MVYVDFDVHRVNCSHKWELFWHIFCVRYSTLIHLLSLRLLCVGGCWDRTQDSYDSGIDSQTL